MKVGNSPDTHTQPYTLIENKGIPIRQIQNK